MLSYADHRGQGPSALPVKMCSSKWPLLLDLTRDDCRRILRNLELEAYCELLSAFRAQGDLTKEKCRLLQELQQMLSISTERHRAEVRRATNDERLATVAHKLAGPESSSEWEVEGRRLVPLLPRLVPQTAFTSTANSAAIQQSERNSALPLPAQTANRERGLNTEDDEMVPPAPHHKRRRRSSSAETAMLSRPQPAITTLAVSKANACSLIAPSSLLGTTISSLPRGSPAKTPSQKVIIVSSASQRTMTHNIVQKSLPFVKGSNSITVTTSSFTQPRSSIIMPPPPPNSSSSQPNGNLGNIITVATSQSAVSSNTVSTPAHYIQSTPRPRVKTITTRAKAPSQAGRGFMLPMGSSPSVQHPSPIHMKTGKPAIHIKQEGSMKIITQAVPSSANKILPKPPGQVAASSVIMTASAAQSSVGMVTKSANNAGGKVLNISAGGSRIVSGTSSLRGATANVVTVNPKTLQLTTMKGTGATTVLTGNRICTPSGSKSNVIVVQKAAGKRIVAQSSSSAGVVTVSTAAASVGGPQVTAQTITLPRSPPGAVSSAFEKELVSFIQRQDSQKQQKVILDKKGSIAKTIMDGPKKTVVVRQRSVSSSLDGSSKRENSLLAELIQAVGIGPEGSIIEQAPDEDSRAAAVLAAAKNEAGGSQWLEYDEIATTQDHSNREELTDSADAIKALLEMQAGKVVKVQTSEGQRLVTYNLQQLQSQLSQANVLTLDQGGTIVQSQAAEEEDPQIQFIQEDSVAPAQPVVSTTSGELDPSTGVYYTADGRKISSEKAQDFLSSALSQAQIDLDPYQFIETEEEVPKEMVSLLSGGGGGGGGVVQEEEVEEEEEPQEKTIIISASSSSSNGEAKVPPAPPRQQQAAPPQQHFISLQDAKMQVKKVGTSCEKVVQVLPSSAVAVEHMGQDAHISSFTSQQQSEDSREDAVLSSPQAGSSSLDGSGLGKRKRKAPMLADEINSSTPGGWVRLALGLVQKISRFRGNHKEKGEMNAASWFTQPVDPLDVADYYDVIKSPMDLSTVKRKLEAGMYDAWDDFDRDFMLIRENCIAYNPEGTVVRRDCDDLFAYYAQEYEKVLQRWQLSQTGSPQTKRSKVALSPLRS
ncbi:hypothetical protein CAPTEDRAFT_228047 [Capitella teleta]|uniref:Bromo domain-containing protein n=1 Tax=Capitella teleta TaxID=283909 RepID=R7TGF0_CAPTE|nr:hypothetical protein CAPTEDRAFT_228047 [Capitella teleta]|eukprot:ELT92779.1 hypothetical protein CAPTEDRAFT_228047 [Capitella teleta]